jgi:hypothetical protein
MLLPSKHNNKTAYVIAHYDVNGNLAQYLENLVIYLNSLGSQIIFVSTNLHESGKRRLTPYATVIQRPNIGYDFLSYKIGIEALRGLAHLDRLTLFNSSFISINPAKLFKPFIGAPKKMALRGITFSYDIAPHIQSYFLAFETKELLQSFAFQEWWRNITTLSDKEEVIQKYEIGLTQWFLKNNIPCIPQLSAQRKPIISIDAYFFHGYEVIRDYMSAIFSLYRQIPITANYLMNNHRVKKLLSVEAVTRHLIYLSPIKPKIFSNLMQRLDTIPRVKFSPYNPTHHAWKKLYKRYGVIKTGLLRSNSTQQDLGFFYKSLDYNLFTLVSDALPDKQTRLIPDGEVELGKLPISLYDKIISIEKHPYYLSLLNNDMELFNSFYQERQHLEGFFEHSWDDFLNLKKSIQSLGFQIELGPPMTISEKGQLDGTHRLAILCYLYGPSLRVLLRKGVIHSFA